MTIAASEVYTPRLDRGAVLKNPTPAGSTTVEFLDLTPIIIGRGEVLVEVASASPMYLIMVESVTPATVPTVSATAGDGAMQLLPAGVHTVHVNLDNPVAAYNAATEISFARRM